MNRITRSISAGAKSLVGLVLVVVFAPGCENWPPPPPSKAERVVTEVYSVTFRAPADAAPVNVQEMRFPLDLIPPFRIECVVGLCDADFQPAPTAVFGPSVIERNEAAREFSIDCSRVGGITATASFGTPTPQAFAGAEQLDVAIEHDGTDLIGSARLHGTNGAWLEVSRTALPSAGPFIPKIGVMNLLPGQMISYYSMRVPTNAPYGEGQATPQHQAVRKLAEALNDLADAADAVVAGTPDSAAATQEMQSAGQRVQEAVTALDAAAVVGKKPSAAVRKARKARKTAKAAAKRVTLAIAKIPTSVEPTTKQTKAVVARVSTAALAVAQACDQVLPDDLRTAVGGLTLKTFLRSFPRK